MSHFSLLTREGEQAEGYEGQITFLTEDEALPYGSEYHVLPFAMWEDQATSWGYTELFFWYEGKLLSSEAHYEMVAKITPENDPIRM
jgi:hypothetical protein